jgi:hypothetical protein
MRTLLALPSGEKYTHPLFLGGCMSSDSRERKRSGLAGQIEVEVIRDPQTSGTGIFAANSGNPLRILQELIEQMDELEQSSLDTCEEQSTPLQFERHLARFQRQNSALKRILDKAH